MNLDFHYYVTYLALRNAGLAHNDAKKAAFAAQYVDVSNMDFVKAELLEGIASPTPTVETQQHMAYKNINTHDYELTESKDIWSSFHFLPGNLDDEPERMIFEGPQKTIFYKMSEQDKRDFQYLCLPNSNLCTAMLNDTLQYRGTPHYLHLLGIRLHVLADTWAHEYFAGLNSWWFNEVNGKGMFWKNTKSNVDFVNAKLISSLEIDSPYMRTPEMPSVKSYSYIGHGRAGHLPDLPFAVYFYKPQWSSITREKDNPEEFLKAYNQMVYAVMQIQADQPCQVNAYYQPQGDNDLFLQKEIQARFKNADYKEKYAPDIWMPLIQRVYQAASDDLPVFQEKLWLNTAKEVHERRQDIRQTDYYLFNKAASIHLEFVKSYLREHHLE